jgi:predicted nucleic-acid-binding protein
VIADTNLLLRALDGDQGAQGHVARQRLRQARDTGQPLTVLSATVLEVAYVLESARAGYGWDRAAVADAVAAILDAPGLDVEHANALRTAASSYQVRRCEPRSTARSSRTASRSPKTTTTTTQ